MSSSGREGQASTFFPRCSLWHSHCCTSVVHRQMLLPLAEHEPFQLDGTLRYFCGQ